MNNFGKLFTAVLIFQITSYFSFMAIAQNNAIKRKFYVGVEGGLGLLRLSQNNLPSERNSCFSLDFNGGYIPFDWLRTGISLNGYLIESYGNFYDDPAKGISISNFYGQVEVFPIKRTNLFFKLSGGFSGYTNHHPNASNAHGTGGLLGIGYEKSIFRRTDLSFTVNYGFGRFKDVDNLAVSVKNQHYNITEFMIGITYH
ncbi:MAG TPA: hypothetical protein VGK38_12365 [Prolixibacteraceae bacterium]|jgi:hypothetical protein